MVTSDLPRASLARFFAVQGASLRKFATIAAMGMAVASIGTQAQALKVLECRGEIPARAGFGNFGFGNAPSALGWSVQAGQQIVVDRTSGTGTLRISGGGAVLVEGNDDLTYTVTAAGTYVLEGISTTPGENIDGVFFCREAPPVSTGPTAAQQQVTRASVAQQAASGQANAVGSALSTNIAGRFGGGGVSATRDAIFVSSQGLDRAQNQFERPELNAWASVEARQFSGGSQGHSRSLTLGMDRFVTSDFLLGGFVSLADSKTTANAATTEIRAPLLGIYAARRFDQLFLSAHLGYGRPDYQSATSRFTATRQMVGLSLDGNFEMGLVRIMPALSLSASREALPANGALAADRLTAQQARLSLRVEPLARYGNGVLPYLSLAAEHGRQSSRAAADQSFTKPRLGLGFDWTRGAGVLRLDLDRGNLSANTRDTGLRLSYDWSF